MEISYYWRNFCMTKNRKMYLGFGIGIVVLIIIAILGIHISHSHQVNRILPGHAYQISTSNQGPSGPWQKKQILVFGKGNEEGNVDFVHSKMDADEIKGDDSEFKMHATPWNCTYTATKNSLTIYDNPSNTTKKTLNFDLKNAEVKGNTITGTAKWKDGLGGYGLWDVKLTKIY